MSTEPRQHHYIFGHVALRGLTMSDPERMLNVLASDEAADFLSMLWGRVGDDLPEAVRLGSDGLGVSIEPVPPGIPSAIVSLPAPAGVTEAHLIAIVPVPGNAPGAVACRYITLEYTLSVLDEDAPPRTVLCEWNDRGHLNYGEGPEPTREAFVAAVAKLLAPREDA